MLFEASASRCVAGAAEADCWPRVLVVTAALNRFAASSLLVTDPDMISEALTPGFL